MIQGNDTEYSDYRERFCKLINKKVFNWFRHYDTRVPMTHANDISVYEIESERTIRDLYTSRENFNRRSIVAKNTVKQSETDWDS